MSRIATSVPNRLSRYFRENKGVSHEAQWENRNVEELLRHYFNPISRKNIFEKFYELASQWKEETKLYSSVTDICMHKCYQRIIGMGRDILPLIFHELRKDSDHWFWALSAIAGENPIPRQSAGKVREMKNAWLDWAKKNNFIHDPM